MTHLGFLGCKSAKPKGKQRNWRLKKQLNQTWRKSYKHGWFEGTPIFGNLHLGKFELDQIGGLHQAGLYQLQSYHSYSTPVWPGDKKNHGEETLSTASCWLISPTKQPEFVGIPRAETSHQMNHQWQPPEVNCGHQKILCQWRHSWDYGHGAGWCPSSLAKLVYRWDITNGIITNGIITHL